MNTSYIQGAQIKKKKIGAPSNFRRHEGEMKQGPYWRLKSIRLTLQNLGVMEPKFCRNFMHAVVLEGKQRQINKRKNTTL